jgi:hypothetical protein
MKETTSKGLMMESTKDMVISCFDQIHDAYRMFPLHKSLSQGKIKCNAGEGRGEVDG